MNNVSNLSMFIDFYDINLFNSIHFNACNTSHVTHSLLRILFEMSDGSRQISNVDDIQVYKNRLTKFLDKKSEHTWKLNEIK